MKHLMSTMKMQGLQPYLQMMKILQKALVPQVFYSIYILSRLIPFHVWHYKNVYFINHLHIKVFL